ncbi:hypothetical protein PR202_gb07442 [Eleusine coracana subsp. coracana]|uniref:Uncharacterized protein n=1 Tax=Eleusine coracana subsp. coracana TaxID=191504 RepID=A0AAV5EC33_ELECO|nr:hypothetical protein PR202_gb07442 [Eleusine coracana subsp. coracana]
MVVRVSTATGVTSPASSANSGLKRSRNGSRHVVTSGHSATSPCASMNPIRRRSSSRSRVRRRSRSGDRISERRPRL